MSVLVTGGAGYIGSHMVLALCDAGYDVVVLDNLSTGVAWAVHPKAVLVEGDIADQPLVASIIGDHKVEAIIHFAGSIVVPDSVTDPLGYYSNLRATYALGATKTNAWTLWGLEMSPPLPFDQAHTRILLGVTTHHIGGAVF